MQLRDKIYDSLQLQQLKKSPTTGGGGLSRLCSSTRLTAKLKTNQSSFKHIRMLNLTESFSCVVTLAESIPHSGDLVLTRKV